MIQIKFHQPKGVDVDLVVCQTAGRETSIGALSDIFRFGIETNPAYK